MSKEVFSYWEKSVWRKKYDLMIVGAGIVGFTTALNLRLKFPQKSIAIVEAGQFPYGASTKNAGFACFGSVGEVLDDLKKMDESQVAKIVKMRWDGLAQLKTLVPREAMEYKVMGGMEIFPTDQKEQFESCASKIESLNVLMKNILGIDDTYSVVEQTCGFKAYKNMILNKYEAQLHPAKMIYHLYKQTIKKDIHVFSNMYITGFHKSNGYISLNNKYKNDLLTNQLIICTNAFTKDLLIDHKEVHHLNITPARNQVIMTNEIKGLPFKGCFHLDKGYVYFRNYGQRILLGGARNQDELNERTAILGENEKILNVLKRLLTELIIPNTDFKIEHQWSGIIAVGESKEPIIRQLEDKVYLAARSGGMGVAIGSLIGKKIAALVD